MQNQFSAEFGHSSGGQFNTSIKSGTNLLHGAIYYMSNRKCKTLSLYLCDQLPDQVVQRSLGNPVCSPSTPPATEGIF